MAGLLTLTWHTGAAVRLPPPFPSGTGRSRAAPQETELARKRIIIAAQSPISRRLIGRLLSGLPDVAVVGEAVSGAEAIALVEAEKPDLAVLGAGLANSRDFDSLRPHLLSLSCRWIEIAGRQAGPDGVDATRDRRALPVLSPSLSPAEATAALRAVLAAPVDAPPTALTPTALTPTVAAPTANGLDTPSDRFILIGASTGGVDALIEILSAFPADCPPTAIVQHTGRGYTGSLIQLLGQKCRAEVVAPRDGMELQRGTVCVAAGGEQHLRIRAGSSLRCLLQRGPPVSGHLPSVDVLFQSAVAWADRAVGVILTGMGRDGAEGLAALRQGGAATIGQDEATSLVYGMPRAAWEIGAVEQRLPLSEIAQAVLRATQKSTTR